MKTLMVAGPRPGSLGVDIFKVSLAIDHYFAQAEEKMRVIHGSAGGVDSICAEAAKRHGHEAVPYPVNELDRAIATRRRTPKKAPLYRTIRMLENDRPDLLIAWWNGRSAGTGFTIAEARRRNIPTVVISIADIDSPPDRRQP